MSVVSSYEYDGGSDEIYLVVICPSCDKPTRINDFEDECSHCETLLQLKVEVSIKTRAKSINVMGENDHGK